MRAQVKAERANPCVEMERVAIRDEGSCAKVLRLETAAAKDSERTHLQAPLRRRPLLCHETVFSKGRQLVFDNGVRGTHPMFPYCIERPSANTA